MGNHIKNTDKEFDDMLNDYLDEEVENYNLRKRHVSEVLNVIDYKESAEKYRPRQLW